MNLFLENHELKTSKRSIPEAFTGMDIVAGDFQLPVFESDGLMNIMLSCTYKQNTGSE
jgi:hypothetical protein